MGREGSKLRNRECGEELSQELGGQLEGVSEAENRTPGERPLALINTSMICETTGLTVGASQGQQIELGRFCWLLNLGHAGA